MRQRETPSKRAAHAAADVIAFEDRVEMGQDQMLGVRCGRDDTAFARREMSGNFSLIRVGTFKDEYISAAT